jgi:hypothetical protein
VQVAHWLLRFDDRVVDHWPEYGQAGKENAIVSMWSPAGLFSAKCPLMPHRNARPTGTGLSIAWPRWRPSRWPLASFAGPALGPGRGAGRAVPAAPRRPSVLRGPGPAARRVGGFVFLTSLGARTEPAIQGRRPSAWRSALSAAGGSGWLDRRRAVAA